MAAMAAIPRHNSKAYGGHCGSCRTACRIGYDFLPGDAVGFSGADFVSDVINLATLGIPRRGISHVAIVTAHRLHGICLAESTTFASLPCLIRGEQVKGVQFQHLRERIDSYSGKVLHYPLRDPLDWPEQLSLNVYLLELAAAKCPYDLIGAVRTRTTLYTLAQRLKHGGGAGRREDLKMLFCSELVADAWHRFGIFNGITNASEWNPNALLRAAVRKGIVLPPYQVRRHHG